MHAGKQVRYALNDVAAGGIQPKGADNIVIHDCIVERTNLLGIGVGFDPFWYAPLQIRMVSMLALMPGIGAGAQLCVQILGLRRA